MNLSEFQNVKENIYPKASLCDSRFSNIVFEEVGIMFHFPAGIAVDERQDETANKNEFFRTRDAAVLINDCTSDDIRCRIITRFCLFGKLYYFGREIEPSQMIRFMKGHQLEVVDELYSYRYLFWRCAVHANKRGYTSSELEISIENVKGITYYWNEERQGQKVAFN